MAIELEFISFVVPRKIIEQKYPGGWKQCLEDHANLIGGRVYYDEHLFRDGTMSPMDMKYLVEQWEARGFEPKGMKDGEPYWKDCCVVDFISGPTLPCDWITYNIDSIPISVYMTGTEPGDLAGPDHEKRSEE